ncbi:MAG: hypothetical protein JWP87_6115, partial [Labilithrix sp.]|nr:hypothetical protein [Labilithrix sp.]
MKRLSARTHAATLAVLGAVGLAACAVADIQGDDLGVALPDRVPAVPGTDAGAEGAAPAPASAPEAGATPDAAMPPSLCNEPDLALCYAFEGAIADGSPTKLAPSELTGVSFVTGKAGQAGVFNTTSAVRFGPSPAFEVTTATLEAWVKLAPNPPADGVIFDDDARFSLTILADGTALCKSAGGLLPGGKLVVDQWTHVACVADGTRVHLYVDGIELAASTGTIISSPTSGAALGGNS